ncbi:MAG: BlaI/MecI/CopY family transcriptional regulator [Mariniblastus sp.]
MAKFTPGELKVMKILWDNGELKPAEIQAKYKPPIKNPALRSYLSGLVEKGHVKRRMIGKAYHYKAVTKIGTTFKNSISELVDVFFDGSTDALIMSLIKSEKLSEAELIELKRMANPAKEPAPQKPNTSRAGKPIKKNKTNRKGGKR